MGCRRERVRDGVGSAGNPGVRAGLRGSVPVLRTRDEVLVDGPQRGQEMTCGVAGPMTQAVPRLLYYGRGRMRSRCRISWYTSGTARYAPDAAESLSPLANVVVHQCVLSGPHQPPPAFVAMAPMQPNGQCLCQLMPVLSSLSC